MELADRVSENVIKILYNIKGSVSYDVAKWTQDTSPSKEVQEQEVMLTYLQSSHDTSTNDDL